MEVLIYNNLEADKLKDKVNKVITCLQTGDFRSADVRKMPHVGYYRAKLDDTNRLLFSIGTFAGRRYIFILEVIPNHAYDKSRFLNGAAIDEDKLVPIKNEQLVYGNDKQVVNG